MKCPNCGHELEIDEEEVDIGVGVQRHTTGARCDGCDNGFVPCETCAYWPWQGHAKWCERAKQEGINFLDLEETSDPFGPA